MNLEDLFINYFANYPYEIPPNVFEDAVTAIRTNNYDKYDWGITIELRYITTHWLFRLKIKRW